MANLTSHLSVNHPLLLIQPLSFPNRETFVNLKTQQNITHSWIQFPPFAQGSFLSQSSEILTDSHQDNPSSRNLNNSDLQSLQQTFSSFSAKEIAAPINLNLKQRYQNFIEGNEQIMITLMKSRQLTSPPDSENPENLNQMISLVSQIEQPNQVSNDSFSFTEVIPVGALVLLGLAGVSYGIMRQYSYNPHWHFDLWRKLQKWLGKSQETIADDVVSLHNEALKEIDQIAKNAKRLENQRFEKQDFIHLAILRFQVNQNKGEYEGIAENTQNFQEMMLIKKQQEVMQHIELHHQGYVQQKFYQYCHELLKQTCDIQKIRQSLYQEFTLLLSEVKTPEGRESLQSYLKAMYQLLEYPHQPFSLKLYQALNNLESKEYIALKEVTEIMANLPDQEMTNLKTLTCFVIAHDEIFQQIGKLIHLPKKYNSPQSYARILQYQVMCDRYQASLDKFDQLLEVLKQWYQCYQVIAGIRQEYPPSHYQQPSSFQDKIPSLSLYLKYKNRLCDQTTGISYLDFEEEGINHLNYQ